MTYNAFALRANRRSCAMRDPIRAAWHMDGQQAQLAEGFCLKTNTSERRMK
jgi:hypothetical protein